MLRKEDFMVLQALLQRGLYLCDIAKQVGGSRTVRRALVRGERPRGLVVEAVGWIRSGPTSTGSWPRTSGTRW